MRKITERTPMKERYSLEVPIACLSLSPNMAIVLYQPDDYDAGKCEFVVADLDVFCELISPRRVTTHIDSSGKPYFYRYNRKCYLDEFIRIPESKSAEVMNLLD
jgi:hypothetical protein